MFNYKKDERIIATRKFFLVDNPGNTYKPLRLKKINGVIHARSKVRDEYEIKWEGDTENIYVYERAQIDNAKTISRAV